MRLLSFGDDSSGGLLKRINLPSFEISGGKLKIRWFRTAGFDGLDRTSWRTDAKRYAPPKPKRWTQKKIHSAINQDGRVWNANLRGAIRRPQAPYYDQSPGVVTTIEQAGRESTEDGKTPNPGMVTAIEETDPAEWGVVEGDEEHDSVWDLAAPLGDSENEDPGYQEWEEMTEEEIRERAKAEVLALARSWIRADGEGEQQLIEERLNELLGGKYTGLLLDFLQEEHDSEDLTDFVTTVVEAAAYDTADAEPLAWRIGRAIGSLF
jgi:hypothetical protein